MRAAPHPRPTRRRAPAAAGAPLFVLLLAAAALVSFSSATSEFEFADPDQAPSSSSKETGAEDPGPAELIASVVDDATGLRTDTFLKPLGSLTPGQVMNTRPWGATGRLARPAPNATDAINIIRVSFDLVNGDTRAPQPLDVAYNHHLVIFTRPDKKTLSLLAAAEKLRKAKANAAAGDGAGGVDSAAALPPRVAGGGDSVLIAAALKARGLSSVITPCGAGSFFAGGGAEWRGVQAWDDELRAAGDPWLAGDYLWVEPSGTEWGANVHLLDLRGAATLADTVQCNCAAYSLRTPGTPQDFDHSPLPGGGIACCGDGALGAVAPGTNESAAVPVALLYNVTWLPNTTEALGKMPADVRALKTKVTLQTTLMVSSSAMMDGASCAGEYNSKPCGASEAAMAKYTNRLTTLGDQAPAPHNQTCDDTAADGSSAPVTVAWSHPFRLPADTAYDVKWMSGHQHIGGRNIRLINTTAGADDAVVCESVAKYGTEPGVVGNEKGFIVDMSRCVFDPPLRLAGGQSYVLRSEYGADVDNFAPAAFPPPYEGVMGYMAMHYTVPEGFELGTFSASGNRTMASSLAAAKKAAAAGDNATESTGFCAITPAAAPDDVTPVTIASATTAATAADVAPFTSATPVAALETNGGGGGGGFAQLTLENNFTMQWEFVDGGENVAFKLRLEMPTWMSIGIHRPGGFGMPNADMLVVQSRDDGANFFVMEAWTMGYDSPRPKSFSGSFANSGLSTAGCAVAVDSNGVIEATFKRRATLADPADQLGANITKGEPTVVVWAFGNEKADYALGYHARHAGTSVVTW